METSFMDDATFAEMQSELGVAPEADPAPEAEPAETAPVKDDETVASSEGAPTEDAPEKATDVKPEAGPDGWIPRSRLNQVLEQYKQSQTEMADLRRQLEERSAQPTADSSSQQKDPFDTLMSDIFGDDPPSNADPRLFEHIQSLTSRIDAYEKAQEQAQVKAIQQEWANQIEEVNKVTMEQHGFEIPADFIYDGIRASQGTKHPHEIAEKYIQFALGISKKDAKEIVEEAVEAAPRASRGKRSPSNSRTPDVEPSTVAEASAMAAKALGVDW